MTGTSACPYDKPPVPCGILITNGGQGLIIHDENGTPGYRSTGTITVWQGSGQQTILIAAPSLYVNDITIEAFMAPLLGAAPVEIRIGNTSNSVPGANALINGVFSTHRGVSSVIWSGDAVLSIQQSLSISSGWLKMESGGGPTGNLDLWGSLVFNEAFDNVDARIDEAGNLAKKQQKLASYVRRVPRLLTNGKRQITLEPLPVSVEEVGAGIVPVRLSCDQLKLRSRSTLRIQPDPSDQGVSGYDWVVSANVLNLDSNANISIALQAESSQQIGTNNWLKIMAGSINIMPEPGIALPVFELDVWWDVPSDDIAFPFWVTPLRWTSSSPDVTPTNLQLVSVKIPNSNTYIPPYDLSGVMYYQPANSGGGGGFNFTLAPPCNCSSTGSAGPMSSTGGGGSGGDDNGGGGLSDSAKDSIIAITVIVGLGVFVGGGIWYYRRHVRNKQPLLSTQFDYQQSNP